MPHRSSYLGFPCAACREPVTALTIPREAATPQMTGKAMIRLQCPKCGHDGEYPAVEITRYESHQVI